ncbi:tRNA-dihydrouridine synthase A [Candidatus Competibacter denitrificans Run_A_D11]|uniref:tRNA-dihydrouridine(20/20a) synthase n=1 Tax=Candidatus Competibacter denitrificans Run_A_D11 TaxID=1400863 RepID=W6M259_9GAMM|nr:tRNA dihydrouridine(20/20a) synthase DusA [Candidatus Competibacter denitrificans]CDI01537.1 tRNA-dihydrouridine synthase A [Candidatus Competibacter denitrificans Run_A_D11]HAS85885.1 tRNA dihydrouridine(20/20a) synthase DusA [Candidatus Competibacteraceae bacterium]HRC70836.1 tRNA dihydrouridine(20/20a) synthase DusA [Candidatus Competibacter denitrificans]
MFDRRVSVAPMLDWTDRHCRFFLRLLTRHTLLYTEMVTTGAVLHGNRERLLAYDPAEHPLALQLGGSNPTDLARCARIAADLGYDEINLNVGCPSDRVQSGRFGACLMAEPLLVAECVAAMQAAVDLPVTVKTRIGIDDRDSYEELAEFVRCIALAGCRTLIIHARKAWLTGLSPKENRQIPPLRYDVVYRLKQDFSELRFILNGGVASIQQMAEHLALVDGVMIGRAAYENPYLLAEVDQRFFGTSQPIPTRHDIVHRLLPYVEQQLQAGTPLHCMTRHILGLFQGVPGARAWRRSLSENTHHANAGVEVLTTALRLVPEALAVGA